MPAMAQSSLSPSKTYLHMGDDTQFDPEKIKPKFYLDEKPAGALYGSEYHSEGKPVKKMMDEGHGDENEGEYEDLGDKAYSDWDEWLHYDWPEHLTDTGFTYELKPEANVLRLRGLNDLRKLPMDYWIQDLYGILQKESKAKGERSFWGLENDEINRRFSDLIGRIKKKGEYDLNDESTPLILDFAKLAKNYDAIDFSDSFAQLLGDRRIDHTRFPEFKRFRLPVLDAGQSIVFNRDIVDNARPWTRPVRRSATQFIKSYIYPKNMTFDINAAIDAHLATQTFERGLFRPHVRAPGQRPAAAGAPVAPPAAPAAPAVKPQPVTAGDQDGYRKWRRQQDQQIHDWYRNASKSVDTLSDDDFSLLKGLNDHYTASNSYFDVPDDLFDAYQKRMKAQEPQTPGTVSQQQTEDFKLSFDIDKAIENRQWR